MVFQRVHAWCTQCVYLWPVRTSAQSAPTAQCALHCMQQVSLSAMVWRGGWGWAAVLAGEGVIKVHMQAHGPAMHRTCTSREGCAPLSLLPSPSPRVRLVHHMHFISCMCLVCHMQESLPCM